MVGEHVETPMVNSPQILLPSLVGVRRDAWTSDAARQRSYAEALLALPLADRSALCVDCYIFPHAPVEMDLLAATMSSRPVGINLWHNDSMLDEAMVPSPQVFPAIIGPMDCSAWDDDMWLTHGASSIGSEESVDPVGSEATLWSPSPRDSSSYSMMHSLVGLLPSSKELLGFNTPNVLVEPVVEVCNVIAKVAQTKATSLSLEDFLSKVTCPLP
ncbi:hypothetical protein D1007_16029 [Hordeum vulgare]|nr:hypothetical protein D1007_16029 [Hordeum vulgare]